MGEHTKLDCELKQLREALETEVSEMEKCSQQIAELERSQKKGAAAQEKATAAMQKVATEHAEHAESLKAKRDQYEAEMGLGEGANGEGAKNLQAR